MNGDYYNMRDKRLEERYQTPKEDSDKQIGR